MQKYLDELNDELRLRNYSPKTIKSYILCLKGYFRYKNENLEIVDMQSIKNFLLEKQDKGYSSQTINLYLNAIKYFYREFIKSSQPINIKFAKRSKKLPIVLSRQEIERLISNISNLKHKFFISLSYGAGLRVSEAISLKVKDFDFDNLTIHLKQAKGRKDRITVFPEKIKNDLLTYIIEFVKFSCYN